MPELLQMPFVYCCVQGCSSSKYHLKKWQENYCDVHVFIGSFTCAPPFVLLPFPRDSTAKQEWVHSVNRKDSDHPWKCWQPTKDSRICSRHFVDKEPSILNPCNTPRRVLVRTPIESAKKRKIENDFPVPPYCTHTSQ